MTWCGANGNGVACRSFNDAVLCQHGMAIALAYASAWLDRPLSLSETPRNLHARNFSIMRRLSGAADST
jgi:hypothetical protein